MSIQRLPDDIPFTQIANATLRDDRLAPDTLGVLCYLLSRPPDWIVRHKELAARFGMGSDRTYRIIGELVECGYMERVQGRSGGKFETVDYTVRGTPSPLRENPDAVALTASGKTGRGSAGRGFQAATNKDSHEERDSQTSDSPVTPSRVFELSGEPEPVKVKRACQLASDEMTEAHVSEAGRIGLTEARARSEWDKFCDHHRARGNKFKDWMAAWRTWCRNAATDFGRREPRQSLGTGADPNFVALEDFNRMSAAERAKLSQAQLATVSKQMGRYVP
jgi:hypothetical protein